MPMLGRDSCLTRNSLAKRSAAHKLGPSEKAPPLRTGAPLATAVIRLLYTWKVGAVRMDRGNGFLESTVGSHSDHSQASAHIINVS